VFPLIVSQLAPPVAARKPFGMGLKDYAPVAGLWYDALKCNV
jgi:hypothetical protein